MIARKLRSSSSGDGPSPRGMAPVEDRCASNRARAQKETANDLHAAFLMQAKDANAEAMEAIEAAGKLLKDNAAR